ncbi:hypothetical protein BEL04_05175 [Mucilaginibacter sp. PPCGB 2223]|uniref:putative sensor domain DACNV-containing protein n=1 Tax=Mucilaginibacter sp. PPCGB 2223 TaxID=1886027 RepID=UPI000824BC28|nr:hypothetical protein [Mucilaginibacter sp. PPCGB 2223]OCX53689.1 hypothetical protein BEL04_05175 [Mucilaginibacter sp. PPCGB 2223]
MLSEPTYSAARIVAESIESHFARQLKAADGRLEKQLAPQPPAYLIEAIIDVAFWTSLRKEEGHSPKVSIAYLPPGEAGQPMVFAKRLKFTPDTIIKLAPAIEGAGIYLGVWNDSDTLYIWGTTRVIPAFCFVLDVSEPSLLVIKHRRISGFGKFVNVAVLKGDQIKIIDERSDEIPDCPEMISSLLGFNNPASWSHSINIHVQLAVSMRAHGRGGILLVVPSAHERWAESIIHPINYQLTPLFCGLADLLKQEVAQNDMSLWQEELNKAIESVAGLTAVDGATLINDRHELLAFGAKITRSAKSQRVERMMVTEPVLGVEPRIIHPGAEGGTRHLSAAQFVFDQRDAIAMVASQDGRFTIFSWSPCEGMVHAHRVDSLLL